MIIDDGSTDGSFGLAEQICRDADVEHAVVLQHEDRKNHGAAASRNLGLQICTGDLVCFLDADDMYLPHRFLESVRLLAENPQIDGVYESAKVVDDGDPSLLSWGVGPLFELDNSAAKEGLLPALIMGKSWHTSAILVRRRLFNECGMFEETLKVAEDSNLWMRMALVGNLVRGNTKEPVSLYIRRPDSLYKPALERRLDYFAALQRFRRWIIQREFNSQVIGLVDSELEKWIDQALIVFREQGRFDLIIDLCSQMIKNLPHAFFSKRVMAHFLFGSLEALGVRRIAST